MKIIKLESFTKPFVSFVRVTLEDGTSGFGQMSTYHADITAQIFHKQLAPWVLGKNWENFEGIEKLILEKEHKLHTTCNSRFGYSFMGHKRKNYRATYSINYWR